MDVSVSSNSYRVTGTVPVLLFVSGFVLAAALAVPVFVVLQRRTASSRSAKDAHLQQLTELGKLTGGLAHEIKNPLSTIKVNLKLISEAADSADPKYAAWLRKISVLQKESTRLEQILEDFLRYIGRVELQLLGVDINTLVGEMVDFYWPQAQAHHVTIRSSLAKEHIVCKIDEPMIKQVILNLFINATQSMPDGGELIVRTKADKTRGIIEISDTGSGIDPANIDRIFQAYYTSRPGGSGLGLPIARKIIEAHNGRITVNSEKGTGSSFTVQLPLEAKEIAKDNE